MNFSGLIQAQYNQRDNISTGLSRSNMTPQFMSSGSYTTSSASNHQDSRPHLQHHNPFSVSPYAGVSSNGLVPAFASNYIQRRPEVRMMNTLSFDGLPHSTRYVQESQKDFGTHHSPVIKSESQTFPSSDKPWAVPNSATTLRAPITEPAASTADVNFETDVDTLMKAIQSQQSTSPSLQTTPVSVVNHVVRTACSLHLLLLLWTTPLQIDDRS